MIPMKAKLSILALSLLIIFGCNKDKYQTRPQLKLISSRVGILTVDGGSSGSAVEFEMEVTDKEGDVKDSLYIDKKDAATIPCPDNSLSTPLSYKIPDYPSGKNQKVLIRVRFATINALGYGLLGGAGCLPARDTSVFRFWVKDKAGNLSDTITTESIVLPL